MSKQVEKIVKRIEIDIKHKEMKRNVWESKQTQY